MWYHIHMNEKQKKQIADIMEKHGVIVGYLFGSAQKGTMGPYSDIDTAVFFDEKKVPQEKQFDVKLSISSEIANAFHVNDADVIVLNTIVDPLIKYISVFDGELIFAKDVDTRFALERYVVRQYEDTKSLRSIMSDVFREDLKAGTFGKIAV